MNDSIIIAKQLNRRGVFVPPANIDIVGSLSGGYLLSQIFYWSEVQEQKTGDSEFFKTDAEWMDELRLTLYELKTAKKLVKDLGIVSIVRKGIPAKTYYKLDFEAYVSLITSYGKSQQLVVENLNNRSLEIPTTNTETTTETTSNKNIKKDFKVDFERFWKAYPKKVAKETARKAFAKAIKKTDIETILKSVSVYTVSQDSNFYANPATWLNGHQWLDEGKVETKAQPISTELKQRYGVDKMVCDGILKRMGKPYYLSFVEQTNALFSEIDGDLKLTIKTSYACDRLLDDCTSIIESLGYNYVVKDII